MINSLSPQIFILQPNFFWVSNFACHFSQFHIFPQKNNTTNHQQITIITNIHQETDRNSLKQQKRRTWTIQQDQKLLSIIDTMNYSDSNRLQYYRIAKLFEGRTSKQIRQRFLNHLNGNINKSPFSSNEDKQILKFYFQNGPKWKSLSLIMKGRTPTALKNRFNTKLKQKQSFQIISCQQPIQKYNLLVEKSESILNQKRIP